MATGYHNGSHLKAIDMHYFVYLISDPCLMILCTLHLEIAPGFMGTVLLQQDDYKLVCTCVSNHIPGYSNFVQTLMYLPV